MNTELTISLPQPLKDFIDARVAEGRYATPSDYVRELLQEALEGAAEEHLEKLLLEGLESGEPIEVTPEFWQQLRAELVAKHGDRQEGK